MIAPIREVEPPPRRAPSRSSEMRRLVASLFLDETRDSRPNAPTVSRWKAWLLLTWAVTVTTFYLASMLGLL